MLPFVIVFVMDCCHTSFDLCLWQLFLCFFNYRRDTATELSLRCCTATQSNAALRIQIQKQNEAVDVCRFKRSQRVRHLLSIFVDVVNILKLYIIINEYNLKLTTKLINDQWSNKFVVYNNKSAARVFRDLWTHHTCTMVTCKITVVLRIINMYA